VVQSRRAIALAEGTMAGSGFEWDEVKRAFNVLKHGIDFSDAVLVFADDRAISVKTYAGSDEERWITVGRAAGRIIAVIHTQRGERTRLISARAARDKEREAYGRR
jgi:uncharacterized DUF497 family protein